MTKSHGWFLPESYRAVVFSGEARPPKALIGAYSGVISAMIDDHLLDSFQVSVGCGLGAYFAMLLAMHADPRECAPLPSSTLEPRHSRLLIDIFRLFSRYGLDRAEDLIAHLRAVVHARFPLLQCQHNDLTLQQLYKVTGVTLAMSAINVSTQELLFLDHKTYPQMPVFIATAISMSTPLLHEPFQWDGHLYTCAAHADPMPRDYPLRYYDASQVLSVEARFTATGIDHPVSLSDYILSLFSARSNYRHANPHTLTITEETLEGAQRCTSDYLSQYASDNCPNSI